MAVIDDLQSRIDAEFASSEQQLKSIQTEAVKTYEGRQERFQLFAKACEQLHNVWRPRLETLSKKLGDQVKVTPKVSRGLRQATFDVESKLARVQLTFSASTDTDVRKLVLQYDLEILPILMEFQRHAQAEFPLEAVDAAAVGKWIDDRIVDFVKTYLAMTHNQYYLKDHMVTDPVAGLQLPKFAAAATVESGGKTYYFISEKTRDEFLAKEGTGTASKGTAK